MANKKQLEKRIKSVGNIAKITKAMEMVAASKMRQAQKSALASRPYARKLGQVLAKIGQVVDPNLHPLFSRQTDSNQEAVLVISTDRGLTGSLNTSLFKALDNFLSDHKADIYTLGRLAKEFAVKSDFRLKAEFGPVEETLEYQDIQPVASLLIKDYLAGKYQTVWLAYMDFVSTLSQRPSISQLLPLAKTGQADWANTPTSNQLYLFEPDAKSLLNWILPYSVEMTLYQALLEARASEHSARMVAMKNSAENATELGSSLSLEFNRSRQASITNELGDIVTATLSVNG